MIPCPFCQNPIPRVSNPDIKDWCDHYFENPTCPNCQTQDVSLEFNIQYFKDNSNPKLINYRMKHNGFTIWIGVKHPFCEVTEDWHTSRTEFGTMQSMCHLIFKSESHSPKVSPKSFPNFLKTILVFS